MPFHTPSFLFLFLPVCLILYFLAGQKMRNSVLLAASLIFFAWGQAFYLPFMGVLILVNYILGLRIQHYRDQPEVARGHMLFGVGLNLLVLAFFKLLAGYGNGFLGPLTAVPWLNAGIVPLGLSYIAFQVTAYLIDVYHQVCDAEKNLFDFGLYVLLFPKIITGPITRYQHLADQIKNRAVTIEGVSSGLRRFIIGFAKKALIADQLARVVDPAFALSSPSFTTGIAWLVLVGYTLQLYFDFSGYIDMAIGLGQALGFKFVENFNYPYISKSIGEFWRRWHISLSSWFRDYVFYPLEFANRRLGRYRQFINLLIIFLLTGLWHGFKVNFILWGLLHGLAVALEVTVYGRWLKKAWAPVQHGYALLIIMAGWVFFRAPGLTYALQFFARLAGSKQEVEVLPFSKTVPLPIIDPSIWLALGLGLLFSVPLLPAIQAGWQRVFKKPSLPSSAPAVLVYDLVLLFLLVSSIAATVADKVVLTIYGGF